MKAHPLSKMPDAKMVLHAARHFQHRAEFDDLVSEGMIGLLNARRTFDPERGKWNTHAYNCIVHYMHQFSRNNRSLVGGCSKVRGTEQKNPDRRRLAEVASDRCASIDEPIFDDKTLADVLRSDIPAPDDMAARLESVRRVRAAMRVLNARDFKIVSESFDHSEQTQRGVGANNGMSKRRVQQILERVMFKLAGELARKVAA